MSGLIDEALDQVGGLRTACPAKRIHRGGGGEYRGHIDVHGGRGVQPLHESTVEIGGNARPKGGEIGAHTGERLDPKAHHILVLVEPHLRLGVVVAAVSIGDEALRALRRPLDRPTDLLGTPDDDHFFGVVRDLAAEATAHVGRDDPHLVLGEAHDEGAHQQADDVRVLGSGVQGVVVPGTVVVANGAAGFDGVADQSLIVELNRGDVVGISHRLVRLFLVAQAPVEDYVVGHVVEYLGSARLGGLDHVDDGLQDIVVHVHELGRIDGLCRRLGDDYGNGITYVPDLVYGQRGMRRLLHGVAVLEIDLPAGRQTANEVGGHFLTRQHGYDPGRRAGRRAVDAFDLGVRVGAADDGGIGHFGQHDIVDVSAFAGDESLILNALYGLSTYACHGILLSSPARWRRV